MPVTWTGMAEYREQLRQLPEACVGEAAKVIEGETNAAYRTVAAGYVGHQVSGGLLKRLRLSPLRSGGALTTGVKLTSGSPIAWLFDNGSRARHWVSGKSTGQMWGHTPPTHIFSRTVGRTRRSIIKQLKEAMARRGATVSGDE